MGLANHALEPGASIGLLHFSSTTSCVGVHSKTYDVGMSLNHAAAEPLLGIAEIAQRSGLTQDTLRWYEREGLLPRVNRGSDGRRQYTEREAALVVMLAKLRESGMPTHEMRNFAQLVAGGATTHGQRLEILERHRERIHDQQARLAAGLAALEDKAAHYRALIEASLDCDGAPISEETAAQQRERY